MSSKKTSKQQARKPGRRSREYSTLTLIIIIVLLLAVSILIGTIIKQRNANPVPTITEAPAVLQYDNPPPMTIDVNMQYLATVKMQKGGEFVIELYPAKAPLTVNNFVFLAREG